MSVTLADIEAARARIAKRVRRTPMLDVGPMRDPGGLDVALSLKLECQQITGSFKARGASHKLAGLDDAALARGLITASGGNHGLGVAYAAWQAKVPARIVLPTSTPQAKAEALAAWGAEVIWHGAVWDEANSHALARAAAEGFCYVHPFADPAVIAGQGTTALELLEQRPDSEILMIAIGGGGLISGMAIAAKALKPDIRIIGVEPVGAPTLYNSLAAGEAIALDSIETAAGTLAPRRSDPLNLAIIAEHVEEIVLVDDEAMLNAARWLWSEFGIAAELSGAAATAALLTGAVRAPPGAAVVSLVCGAGRDGLG